jgi:hypothetical protein
MKTALEIVNCICPSYTVRANVSITRVKLPVSGNAVLGIFRFLLANGTVILSNLIHATSISAVDEGLASCLSGVCGNSSLRLATTGL